MTATEEALAGYHEARIRAMRQAIEELRHLVVHLAALISSLGVYPDEVAKAVAVVEKYQ